MAKVTLPPDRCMYPRPALLVGTNVDDKPNFMAVGGGGVVNAKPPMIGIPHGGISLSFLWERSGQSI